jgi:Predicted hydrolases or acyltransferases (alpha/beta hydrolase superfamily)
MKITIDDSSVYCYTNSRNIDSSKPSIVFIHGSGMDHTVWTLAARHFARHGNNVIAVDLPGHGRSTGAPLQSIPSMADWLEKVLDALEVEAAAVVGHSLGSLIALDFSASTLTCTSLAMVGTSYHASLWCILDAVRQRSCGI